MKRFIYSFSGEYKMNLYRRNLLAWLIILIFLIFYSNAGVNKIKQIPDKEKNFSQIQYNCFKNFSLYLMYQISGIDILFVIPDTAIICNETAIADDLSSKFDGFSKLQIFTNFKGKAFDSQGKGIQPDISVIIKLLGSLIALWYFSGTAKNTDYLKYMSSIWTPIKSFIYTTFSRFLLFSITFLFVMGIVFLFIWARGITFSPGDFSVIAGFLLNTLVFLAIFFFLGALIWVLFKREFALLFIFLFWFFINFASYWFIKPAVEPGFPDTLKEYQTVLDKMTIFTDFEVYAEKRYGKFDRSKIEEGRKVIEDFWDNYYLKKIASKEKQLRDMIAGSIEKDRRISRFFPGLFFDMTANEVSGRGYENYLRFYDYTMEMKAKFVRFIIDRVYYNDPEVMVNFIQGDEDIFRGKGVLPPNYWSGIFIQLVYLVILIVACYFSYARKLFPRPKNVSAFDNLSVDFKSGENFSLWDYTNDDNLRTQLVNVFFGKNRELPLKLTMDGKPFPAGEKVDFIFVPKPGHIPGELKGKHLVRFFKRVFNLPGQDIAQLEKDFGEKTLNKHFCKMNKKEKYKLLLSLVFLCKSPIYLFDNFAVGVSGPLGAELDEFVNEKLPDGSMIIDLSVLEKKWHYQEYWFAVHLIKSKYRLMKLQ